MRFEQVNYLIDVIMPKLQNANAFAVVSLVARNTWGMKDTEWIDLSFSDISAATGIKSVNTIKKAISLSDDFIEKRPLPNQGYEYRMKTVSKNDIVNSKTLSNSDMSKNDTVSEFDTDEYQKMTPPVSKNDIDTPDTSYKEEKEVKEIKNPPNPPEDEIELEMPEPYKPKYLRWLPVPLQCDKGMDTWAMWEEYRSGLGVFTEQSAKAQLKELGEWGIDRAEAAVKHSIKQGYKGIYEPNKPTTNGRTPAPADDPYFADIKPVGGLY